jgi:hypothetical protein
MTDLWYYAEGEQARGPLSLTELVPLLTRIPDPRRVMVWRQGFTDWKPLEQVREVAQEVFKPPPLIKAAHRPLPRHLRRYENLWSTPMTQRRSRT